MAAARRGSAESYNFPRTIRVSHLGGLEVRYRMNGPYKQYKPSLVLINSFTTSLDLYESQFDKTELTDAMNLIAIEPLGHGGTSIRSPAVETFTYWDTAHLVVQVLDAIGVKKAFALGTSQGGWIVARLALIAPERIAGIIPLGTSMDYESERSRKLGCWDPSESLTALIDSLTSSSPTPDFVPTDDYCNFIVTAGFGNDAPDAVRKRWYELVKKNYAGDAGRKRMREAAVNLRDRDGLHGRVGNIKCPVLWLHGDQDQVYSVKNAQEEIKMFTGSPSAEVVVVQGGHHFLSATHPKEVDALVAKFVLEHSKGMQGLDARSLREAVGMVDI